MKDALTIHRMLLERETLHEIVRLPTAISHADELPKVLGLPADRCLVTHVYTVGSVRREARSLAAVIVRAGHEPALEPVRRRLGVRAVRPARADHINAVTEYTAHLVCPLLLPPGMPLLVDRSIGEGTGDGSAGGVVYTATGEASTALGIGLADLLALCGAEPIELPPPAPAVSGAEPAYAPPYSAYSPDSPYSTDQSSPPAPPYAPAQPRAPRVGARTAPAGKPRTAPGQGSAGTGAAVAERPPRRR